MAEAENIVNTEAKDSKVYEVGYLLVPTIKEEDVPITYGNLKELITSLGGEVIMDDMPKMINLAYPMQKVVSNVRNKFTSAYFGWTKFLMDGEKVTTLKNRLDLDPNFVRFLIIKTVKENTIAARRFVRPDTYKRPTARKTENEPALPINEAEVDKEIEALVAAQ